MSDTSIPHIHVFIAYAIEDKKVFEELKKHIDKPLKIKKWEEGNTIAAKPVSEQIQEKLQKTDVCIPLISSDLVNSPHFSLLQSQAQQNSQLKVVPILARAYNWQKSDFLERYQILPRNGKPIISTGQITPDEVYTEIVKELAKLFSEYGECEIHVSSLYINQPTIEQAQSTTKPTPPISNSRKKWSIIGVLTLIALFAGLYADLPPMIKDFKNYVFGKEEFVKQDSTSIEKTTALVPSKTFNYTPLFEEEDSTHFNILVIRFEDYIAKEETYCIGRSIKENLEVMNVSKEMSLPLQIKYVHDSISPPENQAAAILVQKRHFADLIIYGLARNVQENCRGAEVCFRYAIADEVVANVAPKEEVKSFKHDLKYVETSPMAIEEGKLQIDSISMQTWITALVDIKDDKTEEGLDGIENMITENIEYLSKEEQVEEYFNQAKIYYDLEQYGQAIISYTKVIKISPNFIKAYINRGILYGQKQEYQNAIVDLTRVVEINPNLEEGYFYRAYAYEDLGEYQNAIVDLTKVIDLNPFNVNVYHNRGMIFLKIKDYERAIQDFTKSIKLAPDNPAFYYALGHTYFTLEQYENALKVLKKGFEIGKKHMISSHEYVKDKMFHETIKFISRAIERTSKLLEIDYVLINTYSEMIESSLDLTSMIYKQGILYQDSSNQEQAIIFFTGAIEESCYYNLTYNSEGHAYYQLEHSQRLNGISTKLFELNIIYSNIHNSRGQSFHILKDYQKAIEDYTQAIELNPKNVEAYKNRSISLHVIRYYEQELTDYKKIIQLNPFNYEAYINTIRTYIIWKKHILIPIFILLLLLLFRKKLKSLFQSKFSKK